MNLLQKLIGIILLIAGLLLSCKPDLKGQKPSPEDSYQMIEERVKWGFLIGLGIFSIVFNDWNSWKLVSFGLLSFLTLGIVVARLFGMALDGLYPKQILWLGLEMLFLIVFGYFYWKQKYSI